MAINKLFSNRNICVVATLFFVVWVLFFDRNNYLDLRVLNTKIEKLEAECDYFRAQISRDSAVIEGFKDSAFVEKFAREHFLMQRPGEVVYIIDQQKKDSI